MFTSWMITNFFVYGSISCTDVLSKWLVPPSKTAEMAKIKNINWSRDTATTTRSSKNVAPPLLMAFDHTEMDDILSKIDDAGALVPLMALREPYATRFVAKDNESLIASFHYKLMMMRVVCQ